MRPNNWQIMQNGKMERRTKALTFGLMQEVAKFQMKIEKLKFCKMCCCNTPTRHPPRQAFTDVLQCRCS